jgi:hypothetical protein
MDENMGITRPNKIVMPYRSNPRIGVVGVETGRNNYIPGGLGRLYRPKNEVFL